MPIIALIIIGAAAGFLATRLMRLETDIITTVCIGMAGALVSGLVLRGLLAMMGFMAGFVGAVLGALVLIWLWQRYVSR
ncbi:GlsB/YeaQ/YmgE family stress response membrane protein [Leisingera caerulea]|uniref:GlsB/YeaQ/YmgE family stress response membrane protein n=1 Tax=Leisingera caerulea TaxID=506591 RepID=UPI0021A696FF|nr:GlsB/YeaQ/YmgE family stress response membrane protein [Leisingera caerulea]UWQ83758.1 GlsB/YeaQ/YmgE family stress response membrane protein [Leisingera caerulea]